MAALFESDSEGEEFLGFDVEGEPQRSNVQSESDVTVSSVIMEELSDISVTSSESGEVADEEWNLIPDPVVVNPFVQILVLYTMLADFPYFISST